MGSHQFGCGNKSLGGRVITPILLAVPSRKARSDFTTSVRANWRLLLAIAERAGGGWKSRAQRAARAIEEVHDTFEPAIGIRLLADIRIDI